MKTNDIETSTIYNLFEGLYRLGNNTCDDIIREKFQEGRFNRTKRSIVS